MSPQIDMIRGIGQQGIRVLGYEPSPDIQDNDKGSIPEQDSQDDQQLDDVQEVPPHSHPRHHLDQCSLGVNAALLLCILHRFQVCLQCILGLMWGQREVNVGSMLDPPFGKRAND